ASGRHIQTDQQLSRCGQYLQFEPISMRPGPIFLGALLSLAALGAGAPVTSVNFPAKVETSHSFSVPTSGSGPATLYIIGPGGAFARKLQLGETLSFGSDDLHSAGHYIAILDTGGGFLPTQFDVTASAQPAKLSFLAKPSRLPVSLSDGISGV